MTTSLTGQVQFQGSLGTYGATANRVLAFVVNGDEHIEQTVVVKSTDVNKIVSLAEFLAGADFIALQVKDQPVQVRFNSDTADAFTIPVGGVMVMSLLTGIGIDTINDIRLTGVVTGDSQVYLFAVGSES